MKTKKRVENGGGLAAALFKACSSLGEPWIRVSPADTRGLPSGTRSIEVANPDGSRFTAVPYCAWDNRAPGRMRVWADEREGA